jgi:hypothetical protein
MKTSFNSRFIPFSIDLIISKTTSQINLQGRFPNGEMPILMKLTENDLYEKCIKNLGSIFAKQPIYTLHSIFEIKF